MYKILWLFATIFLSALLPVELINPTHAAEKTFITIGTGDINGVYYPAGGAICQVVNKGRKEHGIRCLIESTNGSVYNLNAAHVGELDMGIAQSDWQYHAYHGTSKFKEQGPFKDLRAIFSLHAEPFTVLARKDSGIRIFDDLKGKRVNIGNPGSGQRGTMEILMQVKGWTRDDFAETLELKPADQVQALCDNKVDAIVYTVGHPNGSILEATTACDSVLVEVAGEVVDKLVADNPYYALATVPGRMYRGNPEDVKTFGVKATLVSSVSIPDEIIYWTVKSVLENFDRLRQLHPALARLDKKSMVTDGNTAPLHPGAIRYFKEAGLIE